MVSVTDLRNGTIFEEDKSLYQVLSYSHIKMGRGSAVIKIKVKNLKNGATTEKSFINGAKVNEVNIVKKELQYLYKDDEKAYFMHPVTFEQVAIPLKIMEGHEYLKEGENFFISFLDYEPLSLNLPPKMDFKVVEAGSSARGNSVSNVFKDVVLENGLKAKAPLFIKEGDIIKIDTRTGEYTQKA